MLKPKYLQEINIAVDHLINFTDKNAKWSKRFDDFKNELFNRPARRLNCYTDDIEVALLDSVWLDESGGFLTHEAAVTRWNNEPGSMVTDYLKKRGARESTAGRTYLRALNASELVLYQIIQVEPKGRLTLQSFGQAGRELAVIYPNQTVGVSGDWLLGRVLEMGKVSILADSVLLLPPSIAERLQEELYRVPAQLRKLYQMMITEGDVESFPDAQAMADEVAMWQATALCEYAFEMWSLALLSKLTTQSGPFVRLNSDGHEIALTRDRYPLLCDPDTLAQRLNHPPEFDSPNLIRYEFGLIWNWETDNEGVYEHLGRIELFEDSLELECNSVERAEYGRRFLTSWLGDAIGPPQRHQDDMEIFERMAAALGDTCHLSR